MHNRSPPIDDAKKRGYCLQQIHQIAKSQLSNFEPPSFSPFTIKSKPRIFALHRSFFFFQRVWLLTKPQTCYAHQSWKNSKFDQTMTRLAPVVLSSFALVHIVIVRVHIFISIRSAPTNPIRDQSSILVSINEKYGAARFKIQAGTQILQSINIWLF